MDPDRTLEQRAKDGGDFLREAWRPRNMGILELAAKCECTSGEIEAAVDHGRGPMDGLPEPRVIWALCRALNADYLLAMEAFGHRRRRAGPAS